MEHRHATADPEMQARLHDVWADGSAYERYVGRWSLLVAREFLAWLAVPLGARWLDVGCGTGALCRTILDRASPQRVVGLDRSPAYAAYTQSHADSNRLNVLAADAQDLPFASGSHDAVVSGLMLNFVPDAVRAAAEMARVASARGLVAVYVWAYAGKMEFMRHFWDAATLLDGTAADLDEARRFPLCDPQALSALFAQVGPHQIETRAIDVPTVFRDFDDYWLPFTGGQGPAPTYLASLPPERQAGLRDLLRSRLPTAPDGSIHLTARAWAVRGTR